LLVAREECWVGGEQLHRLADHVVEVDQALLLQALLVLGVDEAMPGVPLLIA
jgi:hypothetical protein